MSRYDQFVRHLDWADKMWMIVHESTSDKDFAARLAAFSAHVNAAVALDQRVKDIGDGHETKVNNGTTTPHFTSAADTALALPLDQNPSRA